MKIDRHEKKWLCKAKVARPVCDYENRLKYIYLYCGDLITSDGRRMHIIENYGPKTSVGLFDGRGRAAVLERQKFKIPNFNNVLQGVRLKHEEMFGHPIRDGRYFPFTTEFDRKKAEAAGVIQYRLGGDLPAVHLNIRFVKDAISIMRDPVLFVPPQTAPLIIIDRQRKGLMALIMPIDFGETRPMTRRPMSIKT